MKIELKSVEIKDKSVLSEMILEYETEMMGRNVGEYKYLDSYFEKTDRYPYFIKIDNKIAGFVLVNSYLILANEGKTISEFYIIPEYRKSGIGKVAAIMTLDKFRGNWEIRQIRANQKACSFWLHIISEYTKNTFKNRDVNNEKWDGWIQTFNNHLK